MATGGRKDRGAGGRGRDKGLNFWPFTFASFFISFDLLLSHPPTDSLALPRTLH